MRREREVIPAEAGLVQGLQISRAATRGPGTGRLPVRGWQPGLPAARVLPRAGRSHLSVISPLGTASDT